MLANVGRMLAECWQNVDRMLIECCQNVGKMLSTRFAVTIFTYHTNGGKLPVIPRVNLVITIYLCKKTVYQLR